MWIDESAGKVSIQSCPAGTSVLKGYLLAVFGVNTYEFENDVYEHQIIQILQFKQLHKKIRVLHRIKYHVHMDIQQWNQYQCQLLCNW